MRPSYVDLHLSYASGSGIAQLQTSSHQLEIEVGRYAQIPLEERICQLPYQGVEIEENYVFHCTVFYECKREIPLVLAHYAPTHNECKREIPLILAHYAPTHNPLLCHT